MSLPARTWPDTLHLDGAASWIAPVEGDDRPARRRPVHQLAGTCHLDRVVRSTQLRIDADGHPHASLNHDSKGAVISFLHQYVAGLQLLEPGYRRFRAAPRPGGAIIHACTFHDSPFGRIEVDWSGDPDAGALTVTVPPGTEATALLPGAGADVLLEPGTHRLRW